MAYRTIITYFAATDRAGALLDVAVPLARKHGAHLVGLYVVPQVAVYSPAAVQITTEMLETQRKYFEDESKAVEKLFKERAGGEDIKWEWRSVDARGPLLIETVREHTYCADLVVLGQADPDDPWAPYSELPERLMLEGGRPVLVVPHAGKFNRVGERIMVAWTSSREAARATFDAIPMMHGAKQVKVLSVNPSASAEEESFTPGDEIAVTLARHGIEAETATSVTDNVSVPDEILSRLSDHSCDLLVMGGYGHSRFREMVLGGVTRHILKHMTVPVLLSH